MSFRPFNKRCLSSKCGKMYYREYDGCPYCGYKGFTIRDLKHDKPEHPTSIIETSLNILAEDDNLLPKDLSDKEANAVLDISINVVEELMHICTIHRSINPNSRN